MSLRILAVHRYYWPDTPPYAAMLKQIVGRWQQDGHHVDVLSSQPSYKEALANERRPKSEVIEGVRIERLHLMPEGGRPLRRLYNAIRLAAALIWRALARRYEVILISTAPPVLGGLAASIAARLTGARFIYHCMDIHPEAGRVTGEFANPIVFGILRRLDTWTCRTANPVIVLSRDMEHTLRQRKHGHDFEILIQNNFSLPNDKIDSERVPIDIAPIRLTILFAGNVGRFQGLDVMVEAMGHLNQREDVEFLVMGEGTEKARLKEYATEKGAKVRFLGHQPVHVAKQYMSRADAGFVSLRPDMYHYAFPSKTMTYLEQGCPLIAAIEPQSELATDMIAEGYGLLAPTDDSIALARLIASLADNPGTLAGMRTRAALKAKTCFSEEVVLNTWSELLAGPDGTWQ